MSSQTLTSTLTVTSAIFSNPLVVTLDSASVSFPVSGELKVTAASPSGALAEQITASVTVDGLPILSNATITQFPIDLTGALGSVLSEIVKAADASITLDVRAAG